MFENITVKNFFSFIIPTVLLMVFISIYSMVDSIFIARLVGTEALAGVNLSLPLYSVAFACGVMFATGGGALIAIQLGQGRKSEAGDNLSSLLIVGVIFGLIAALACFVFRDALLILMGASRALLPYARIYGGYLIASFPFLIVKVILETLLRTDGKPRLALYITIFGGVMNIILDYIFIVPMNMGLAGAGLGTFLGIAVSVIPGLAHFMSTRTNMPVRLVRPRRNFLIKTMTNGSSEMVNESAIAITSIVFNLLAIKHMGDKGVAAIAVVMNIFFLLQSLLLGFCFGVSPLISFFHGKGDKETLQKILNWSLIVIGAGSFLFCAVSQLAAKPLVRIYLKPDSPIYDLTLHGFRLFSWVYLFIGFNAYGSAFFTAFGNGKISAVISFLKSFVLFMIAALVLPWILKADGIWLITLTAEFFSFFMVIFFMKRYQGRYGYDLRAAWSLRPLMGKLRKLSESRALL